MDFDSKHGFSTAEKAVIGISVPLNNAKYKQVRRKYPEAFLTLGRLCAETGIDPGCMNELAREKMDTVISGVYRAGSRFMKDCVCVQLYEDADEIMQWAVDHGAAVCVTRRRLEGIPCIVAEDTVRIYASLCRYFRRKSGIHATAVTGSIGKTTAKKMIEAVYRAQYDTFCDAGNDNQIDGVGYICQHIPDRAERWVQEVSEDTPGCVRYISEIVQPSVAVVTAIDQSHIQEYGSEQGILDEIRSITAGMKPDGCLITSCDEANTRELFPETYRRIFVSMKDPAADYIGSDPVVDEAGMRLTITEKASGRSFGIRLNNVFAEHNAYSALYAFAAGVTAGVTYENILRGLAAYRPSGIRQNIYRAKGMTVYADCYNAVARSIRAAAEACDRIPASGKRIAVIGDVEEAGAFSRQVHREIVEIMDHSGFDVLLTFGEKMAEAVNESACRETLTVKSFTDKPSLHREIKKHLEKNGLILFKASHKSRLDQSISNVFPFGYFRNTVAYYWPQVTWRLKVIGSWTK